MVGGGDDGGMSTQAPVASVPSHTTTEEDRSARIAVTVFPLIMIAAFAAAFLFPGVFKPLGAGTTIALGIIMFGMGLTLTPPDFAVVIRKPVPVLVGVAAQFVVMPLLGLVLATLFRLPPELAAGVILVGCAPGGTSSNVISYLAKGDVALSVTMTAISTLLSPLLTPLLTLALAGQYLPVSASAMMLSIVKIVLVPVVAGLVVRLVAKDLVARVVPALPWVSVAGIAYVLLAVVAASSDAIRATGILVLAVVVLHNGCGYALGYAVARVTKAPRKAARAISIEVGMQNSGLAAGLAAQYFSPAAALPAAVFSVWYNVSGGLVAAWWRRHDD